MARFVLSVCRGLTVAVAAYEAAVREWPGTRITVRNCNRALRSPDGGAAARTGE